MKKSSIRTMLAVMGMAAALTGCGKDSGESSPVSEETLQYEEASESSSGSSAESSSETGEAGESGETGDEDKPTEQSADEGSSETGSGEADVVKDDTDFEDGIYMTVDYPADAAGDPDADKRSVLYQAKIADGVLTITSSFEQRNDEWDQIAYYVYETREIPVADDVVIQFGGEEPEETTVEQFNAFYADPDASDREDHRGLGIDLEIKNGEVATITICS